MILAALLVYVACKDWLILYHQQQQQQQYFNDISLILFHAHYRPYTAAVSLVSREHRLCRQCRYCYTPTLHACSHFVHDIAVSQNAIYKPPKPRKTQKVGLLGFPGFFKNPRTIFQEPPKLGFQTNFPAFLVMPLAEPVC